MVVVTKVKSKIVLPKKEAETKGEPKKAEKVSAEVGAEKGEQREESGRKSAGVKKVCYFCKTKTKPFYWDAVALRRYMNDRGKISSRSRLGTCAKHQRCVSREIKHARHLALLPFTAKVR